MIIGSGAIDLTISSVSAHATDTPMNISLHLTASSNQPLIHHGLLGSRIQAVFVTLVSISFVGLSLSLPEYIVPLLSTTTISLIQYFSKRLVIATPAAHTPFTITFTSSFVFPVTFSELMIPASVTTAVPC